jgi:transcriptional regulator with XRE-family HTH domain
MAKFEVKLKAQGLRKLGISINSIAARLGVSKSSASLWCRDIELSKEQITRLLRSKEVGITVGRLKGARTQKMKRLNTIDLAKKEATILRDMSNDEFWFFGLALYLAEGSKKMNRVQFTNSDPRIIEFMLRWFRKFYNIKKSNIRCSILINEAHRYRDKEVKEFWQKYLNIKSERFTDNRYVKTRQNKVYINHRSHFGTFSFRINKSSNLMYRLNAFMDRFLTVGKK